MALRYVMWSNNSFVVKLIYWAQYIAKHRTLQVSKPLIANLTELLPHLLFHWKPQ